MNTRPLLISDSQDTQEINFESEGSILNPKWNLNTAMMHPIPLAFRIYPIVELDIDGVDKVVALHGNVMNISHILGSTGEGSQTTFSGDAFGLRVMGNGRGPS